MPPGCNGYLRGFGKGEAIEEAGGVGKSVFMIEIIDKVT